MSPTPITNFRIPKELREQAQAIAAERGETLTAVVIEALRRYVARNTTKR